MKNKLLYILYIVLVAGLSACTDTLDFFDDDVTINAGDEVLFSAHVPQIATRATAEQEYWDVINRFERVQDDYTFDVTMYEEGVKKVASAQYNPTKNTVNDVTTYDDYGTLKEENSYLYWPSNVKKYAFHAVSSNSTPKVEDGTAGKSDQSTADRFFKQDLIEGYGYVPGWDASAPSPTQNGALGAPMRNLDGYNYLTAKEWYAANKAWSMPEGLSNVELVEFWKKVPLFMRHKRSRITVLLKAGEGVEREQIEYDPQNNKVDVEDNVSVEVYSYDKDDKQIVVTPLLGHYLCQYEATNKLSAEDVETACYDAIVDPHNYADGANMTDQKILAVNLSGMKFSFFAANDKGFSSELDAENGDVKSRYNLTEGKHLILTVTLSTDTRKILITAYVVDWEDWPFSSICDDFGQAADPLAINDKAELIEFLTNEKLNKPGNVGVIMPLNFNLNEPVTGAMLNKKHLVKDNEGHKPDDADYVTTYESGYTPYPAEAIIYPAGWDPKDYDLKATLKLAGATIKTNQRLFKSIAPSGTIVNGTIVVNDTLNPGPIECALALENFGTIERVNVERAASSTRKATRAGLVTKNRGTIYACASTMPVYNTGDGSSNDVLIGGIAAEMVYPTKEENGQEVADVASPPVIDLCNVNARIDGSGNVKGGGIVGRAEGKVTNNTYEYGITLLQSFSNFMNIVYAKGSNDLETTGNQWSTKTPNSVVGGNELTNARPEDERYDQVLDSQAELRVLVTDNAYNQAAKRYRIADSFIVNGDSWEYGIQNQGTGSADGNLLCELDCNNKTLTLTGTQYAKMLFSNIEGHLYDLVLVLEKPIVALPIEGAETNEGKLPARAPLAYAVVGDKAALTNVKVEAVDGAYVQSTASGGLVVWAYDGAIIEDCNSNVDVRIAMPAKSGNQQTYFVGGLVNSAAKATIVRCTYQLESLNDTENTYATPGSTVYYGGIVGGTNKKGIFDPSLNISDCVSWLSWQRTDEYPHSTWGGIIGYSKYQNTFSDLVNATDGNCEGNWWQAPNGASVDGKASGMTEEKVIGKKNSLQPM